MTTGIYIIESKVHPDRSYVGSACNFNSRRNRHLGDLRKDIHNNVKLQAHYNKYGEADLMFSIIVRCDKAELIKKEQEFIDNLNPWFNICKIAGNCTGIKQSKETIEKRVSHIRGVPSKTKGTKHPWDEETKLKAREKRKSKPSPIKGRPSEKKGIKTGRIPPNAFPKGHIPWCSGLTKDTNDTLLRISNKMIGNQHSKGAVRTDEHKRILRELKKDKPLGFVPIKAFKKRNTPWNKGKQTHTPIKEMLIFLGMQTCVPVLQYDKGNSFIKEWSSFAEIQRELNISGSNACQCAKGKVKSAGGFIWKYKEVA